MQLSIYTKTPDARAISHLLAKNPNNVYERIEKGHAVRFVYHEMTDDTLHATIFVTPDSLALVQKDAYDITHYINDREFAVSSIFLSLIRSAFSTAVNGRPKDDYIQFVSKTFPFTFHVGPLATSLSDEEIQALFSPLGFTVEIESISDERLARFLTLYNECTLQSALRQLFILIPVMDDYKHYYLTELERERLLHYGEGWLEQHPMRDFIYKKALRFKQLIGDYKQKQRSLNDTRYDTIAAQVKQLEPRIVIDMGAGEGKLTERLAQLPMQTLYAVDPSNKALAKMATRFRDQHYITTPTIEWGSLYYEDPRFAEADIFILCEVIEHINEERLASIMQLITKRYKPKHLIVTTPNAEYNAVYELQSMRHDDHRFEWTRDEFRTWCETLQGYSFTLHPIGDVHPLYGSPTQMAVFSRREQ